MAEDFSIFKGKLRKITEELVVSAVIVSFIESFLLLSLGALKVGSVEDFIAITTILAVIEIILVIILEELLVSAKLTVRVVISRRREKRAKKKKTRSK